MTHIYSKLVRGSRNNKCFNKNIFFKFRTREEIKTKTARPVVPSSLKRTWSTRNSPPRITACDEKGKIIYFITCAKIISQLRTSLPRIRTTMNYNLVFYLKDVYIFFFCKIYTVGIELFIWRVLGTDVLRMQIMYYLISNR